MTDNQDASQKRETGLRCSKVNELTQTTCFRLITGAPDGIPVRGHIKGFDPGRQDPLGLDSQQNVFELSEHATVIALSVKV